MKRSFFPDRLSYMLSLERFCIAFAVWFGWFIITHHSFTNNATFAPLTKATEFLPGSAEIDMGAVLFIGAALQSLGLWRNSRRLRMWAPLIPCGVFLSVMFSAHSANPNSTGIPAYSGYAALYVILMFRRATNTEWVPLR